jgi:hypothetical protein
MWLIVYTFVVMQRIGLIFILVKTCSAWMRREDRNLNLVQCFVLQPRFVLLHPIDLSK